MRRFIKAAIFPLFLLGCSEGKDAIQAVVVGEPVPSYVAPTLEGDTVTLGELRDHPVLFIIWATWCHPCREEMPGLQALHEEFAGEGLRVIGVSIDRAQADAEVRRFLREYGTTFTILRDPEELATRTFRTTGVPETFLIGRDGVVLARWIGQFDPTSEAVRARIWAALASGGGA